MAVSHILSELGETHLGRREVTAALDCFRQALKAGADPGTHAYERWASWMLLGDFERAWQESDRSGASFRGSLPDTGGRVLIRCQRGLGDGIQFLRYAAALRARCDCLTLQAPARLLPLCQFIHGIDEAFSLESPLQPADYEMECSDLPYLFRATQFTIPLAEGYLKMPPDRIRACRAPLPGRLKVGIVWAAASWNPGRSIPLDILLSLSEIPGVQLFSLQRGEEAEQLRALRDGGRVIELEREDGDLVDTMGIVSHLDLVISVDTMVAHLAGAMGKPVWTLLTYAADWRWMLERTDSPWYASMRLFRQPRPGDWRAVVHAIEEKLEAFSGARSAPDFLL